jgi:hypothetical protein
MVRRGVFIVQCGHSGEVDMEANRCCWGHADILHVGLLLRGAGKHASHD